MDLVAILASLDAPQAMALAAAAGAVLLLAVLWGRATAQRARQDERLARLAEAAERLSAAQAVLSGRVEQSQTAVQLQIEALAARIDGSLDGLGVRTEGVLQALHERLAVIDAARRSIGELNAHVVDLKQVFSNKQARGAFGEVQLADLIGAVLPPDAYRLQAILSTGVRADCLITLPSPPGPIAIDAKFPLEGYQELMAAPDEAARNRAARRFSADVGRHIRDIAEKYIVAGETADSAIFFLPSEAVYAELHARHRHLVEESFRRRVWIVSPTTLWATLHTLRAVLKDVRLAGAARRLQADLDGLIADLARLQQQAERLDRHFTLAVEDLRQLRLTTAATSARAGRLDPAAVVNAEADGAPPPAP
jgi:DNA recombination protein RmuC